MSLYYVPAVLLASLSSLLLSGLLLLHELLPTSSSDIAVCSDVVDVPDWESVGDTIVEGKRDSGSIQAAL